MAAIITIAQQQGGTAKSTLGGTIAAAPSLTGRFLLPDSDPRRGFAHWLVGRSASAGRSDATGVSDLAVRRLTAAADRLQRSCRSPQIDTVTRLPIRAADLAAIRVQPGPPDRRHDEAGGGGTAGVNIGTDAFPHARSRRQTVHQTGGCCAQRGWARPGPPPVRLCRDRGRQRARQ
jgi:hypothetical protein